MSIYARIVLPFVLALAAGALGAWWLATALVADSLGRRLEDQLERAVAALATGRMPLSAELLDRLGDLLGAEVALIPAATAAGTATPTAMTSAALHLLERSPAGGAGNFRRGDTTYSLVVRPIGEALAPRYRALAAATPLTESDQASGRVARLLGGAVVAGSLVIAWIAHRIAAGITRPLRDLSALADRLATGDLHARAHLKGASELVALGRAIERMAAQLAGYQAELAERNRLSALGELAARVAHEVRNPLTAIRLHVELLAERTWGPEDHASLETVLNEINRLELVVATTLGLARPAHAGRVTTDLNALVQAVATLLGPQLAHRRIGLNCDLRPLVPLPLDGDRLKQVLLNLVTNAADALPGGGRIRISTAPDAHGDGVILAVEDSGPGLVCNEREGHPGPGRPGKPHGLGLGLQISREIAAQHGGRLDVEPGEALGGARFVVHLPRAVAARAADEDPPAV